LGGEILALNALTIDVEEWYHATFLGVPESAWPGCERWLIESTSRLLAILAETGVRATFFVLGSVAQEVPDLVRAIAEGGHEIACHSYNHRQVFRQTPAEFALDVERSVKLIEQASQARVLGYRAPACSIGAGQLWAFNILADQGFLYDSSIMPVRTPLYGDGKAPRFPHQVAAGRLLEIPLATLNIGGWRFPMAGGVYLRIFPFALICEAIQRLNQVERQPAVLYLHPWEVDPRPPPLGRNWLARWSHTVNKRRMEARVRQLLDRFSFAPIREVFNLDSSVFA
jgi:polysaccharide deacetylase family protein (PEP-CTERM system associated)